MTSEKTYYQLGKERLLARLSGNPCEVCNKVWPPELMRVIEKDGCKTLHGLYNLSEATLEERLWDNDVLCLNCLKERKHALDR